MSDDLAIETTGLTKRLGHTAVVDQVDLAVPRGSVYGFLGPNGSGKTTTIRMLLGLIWPTAGSFRLAGEDDARRQRLGAPAGRGARRGTGVLSVAHGPTEPAASRRRRARRPAQDARRGASMPP